MGETALVESHLDDAVSLIRELDSEGTPPTLVVWYFYEDAGDWRLLIAGPQFDALLPKQEPVAYRRLVEAMTRLPLSSLTVSNVKLVSSQSPLPQALRMLLRTPANGIVRARFTDTTLNGIFVKEMIILRSA
jgi:hypothetical protein